MVVGGLVSYPIHIEIKGERGEGERKEMRCRRSAAPTTTTVAASSYSRCTRQRLSLNSQCIECRLISKCFLMTAVQQQFIENRMREKDIENIVYVLPAYVDGEQ